MKDLDLKVLVFCHSVKRIPLPRLFEILRKYWNHIAEFGL